VFSGEWAWKAICNWLKMPYYFSAVEHIWKIRYVKQRTDVRKYSFVNRIIKSWNQLLPEALWTLPCKPKTFRNRVRKAIINGVK
jgi:hypothetical protein